MKWMTRLDVLVFLNAIRTCTALGPHGLPTELCVNFWDDLRDILVDVINIYFSTGNVPVSVELRRIILICEDENNLTEPRAWRLISLRNIDYKILIYPLRKRFWNVFSLIETSFRTCSVTGRSIFFFFVVDTWLVRVRNITSVQRNLCFPWPRVVFPQPAFRCFDCLWFFSIFHSNFGKPLQSHFQRTHC